MFFNLLPDSLKFQFKPDWTTVKPLVGLRVCSLLQHSTASLRTKLIKSLIQAKTFLFQIPLFKLLKQNKPSKRIRGEGREYLPFIGNFSRTKFSPQGSSKPVCQVLTIDIYGRNNGRPKSTCEISGLNPRPK